MPDQHAKFIQLRERLRANAERAGDSDFAKGLAHCMLNSSGGGGHMDCPLGRLFVDDYVQTGIMPDGSKPPAPQVSGATPSPPFQAHAEPIKRQAQLTRLHKQLEQEAKWRKDDRYLAALNECNYFMDTNPECPLHRLLHSD